jgi:hypothetical protein
MKAKIAKAPKPTKKSESMRNAMKIKEYEKSHGNKTSDYKQYIKAAKKMAIKKKVAKKGY